MSEPPPAGRQAPGGFAAHCRTDSGPRLARSRGSTLGRRTRAPPKVEGTIALVLYEISTFC